MADYETAARPYAKAIFELARDEDKLEAWHQSLTLAASIAADTDMRALLEQSDHLPRELGEFFLSVLDGAGVEKDGDFTNAIRLLAENSRLPALPAIAAEYSALKQEAEGKIEVQITSAQELSGDQLDKIASSMAKRLGKEVTLTTAIDESLIAGAVITAGDLVIDGSASGRMQKLAVAVNN